jgi:dihydroxyacetone kinase
MTERLLLENAFVVSMDPEIGDQHGCDILVEDGGYRRGDRLLVFVNGAGGMTEMELYTLYGEIEMNLADRGIAAAGCKVGSYLTTQELSGVSVSFCAVDDEMLRLWNAPCNVGKF